MKKKSYEVLVIRVVELKTEGFFCLSGDVTIDPGFDGEIEYPLN